MLTIIQQVLAAEAKVDKVDSVVVWGANRSSIHHVLEFDVAMKVADRVKGLNSIEKLQSDVVSMLFCEPLAILVGLCIKRDTELLHQDLRALGAILVGDDPGEPKLCEVQAAQLVQNFFFASIRLLVPFFVWESF